MMCEYSGKMKYLKKLLEMERFGILLHNGLSETSWIYKKTKSEKLFIRYYLKPGQLVLNILVEKTAYDTSTRTQGSINKICLVFH